MWLVPARGLNHDDGLKEAPLLVELSRDKTNDRVRIDNLVFLIIFVLRHQDRFSAVQRVTFCDTKSTDTADR
jgi:hypothetical protein